MADLALRFGKDMLVVSSPIQEALRRAGIESVCDQALALLVEPETIEEAYRMETVAGPQCMVTPAGSRLQGVACGKSRPVRSCGAILRWPHL